MVLISAGRARNVGMQSHLLLPTLPLAFKNPFIIINYFNMKFFRVGSYLVSINKTDSDQLFTINTQI